MEDKFNNFRKEKKCSQSVISGCTQSLITLLNFITMNKSFSVMLLVSVLSQVPMGVYAQMPAVTVVFNQPQTTAKKNMQGDLDAQSFSNRYPTEISTKAIRDFTQSFKLAEDVHWYKVIDGTMVYFTVAGIKNRTGYDNYGNRLYNMRFYTAPQLSEEIRKRVKSVYYDYSITWISEITRGEEVTFLVHVEDKISCSIVRVCEGEDMEVIERYIK